MRYLDAVLLAAIASSSVAATVSDELVRAMARTPADAQKVIVLFKDAPGASVKMQSTRGDRGATIEAMRQNAALAQAAFKSELGLGFDDAKVVSNWLINGIIMEATPEQIEAIQGRDDVKHVELDATIQLDPVVEARATGDDQVSTWGLKAVKALEARAAFGVDGSGVVVGILDTGYDANHPALAGKLLAFHDPVGGKTTPYDDNGHGTHCAGTIGGSSDGMQIGMAPGAKFVAGKIFSSGGSAQVSWIVDGMQWIVDPDKVPNSGDEPRLVSNSWGGGPGQTTFLEAVKGWLQLGIAPIFAAGNSGPGAGSVGTPGGFLESLAVGATNVNTQIADFSSRGPVQWNGQSHIKPDVSAPGEDVTSAKAGGGYVTFSGTSMATPHVAGLATLLLQANPDLTWQQLREVLETTTIDEGPAGKDNDWGTGRIDAMAALSIVISGGKVAGKVVGADGAPVSHAVLTIAENGLKIRLKDDGSFKITLKEGTYTINAKAFGFVDATPASVTVVAGEETSVEIVLAKAESGTVKGVLTGAGSAVEGKLHILETPLPMVATGADGSFSIDLPAGSYKAMAHAYGYEHGVSDAFTVVAGQETELALDLAKLPPVLVVDDDKGKSFETFYVAALGDKAHKVLDAAALSDAVSGKELAQYETVVWFTGNEYTNTVSAAEQAALTEYLSLGGRLFITGQDIGYELKETAFYKGALKAKWVKDTADSKAVTGAGLSFNIEGGDGANNQRYADTCSAQEGGEMFVKYADGAGAGVRQASGNGKSVYLSFGFEGIDTAANRKAMMDGVLAYLAPSAADMAARAEAVAKLAPASEAEARELAALKAALEGIAADRIQAEGGAAALAGSASRDLRRISNFR